MFSRTPWKLCVLLRELGCSLLIWLVTVEYTSDKFLVFFLRETFPSLRRDYI